MDDPLTKGHHSGISGQNPGYGIKSTQISQNVQGKFQIAYVQLHISVCIIYSKMEVTSRYEYIMTEGITGG